MIAPADLAAAFAALLSRDGRATMYGPRNEDVGDTLPVVEAVRCAERAARAVFVHVRHDVFAFDVDDPALWPIARRLADGWRRPGLVPVVVESGPSGERGHVIVQVSDARERRELLESARAAGIRPHNTIRPPTSLHRLGGRGRLLAPTDAIAALCALAPTTAPPRRLPRKWRELLAKGDPTGRHFPRDDGKHGADTSRLAAAIVLAMVNAGWTDEAIRRALEDPDNAGAAKVHAKMGADSDRYIRSLIRSARVRAAASPLARSRPGVDLLCERVDAIVLAPAFADGDPMPIVGARVATQFARAAGKDVVDIGSRTYAEALGTSQPTGSRLLRHLARCGVLELARGGAGPWASKWRIRVPDSHLLAPSGPLGVGGVSQAPGTSRRCESQHGASASRRCESQPHCLTSWVFPDVFGPLGWFGRKGLGFAPALALVVVDDARGDVVPASCIEVLLGARAPAALARLARHDLVVASPNGYRRGPAALDAVAFDLGTLGTRTWRRALHAAERYQQRAELETLRRPLRRAARIRRVSPAHGAVGDAR
jgi:hypothetical protein